MIPTSGLAHRLDSRVAFRLRNLADDPLHSRGLARVDEHIGCPAAGGRGSGGRGPAVGMGLVCVWASRRTAGVENAPAWASAGTLRLKVPGW